MTNDKGILIRNIYYMLSYAFSNLRKNNYENVAKEEFERIEDLFAEILYKGISAQLKLGLYKEYIYKDAELPLLRGKLNIAQTIKLRTNQKNLLGCEFDELSENNIFNQILKTVAEMLIFRSDIKVERKRQLKNILVFFQEIDTINPSEIKWNTLKFQNNNKGYRMLINICYFVLEGMLLTTEKGKYRVSTFSEEHMNKLFERFVLEYYKVHYKDLKVSAPTIKWDLSEERDCVIDFLPEMKSDIVIADENHTLIIDTKYYTKTLQTNFDHKTIHSNNLYQIFTYVKNKDVEKKGNVSGVLLYAKTQERVLPIMDAKFGGNRIMVKTLDLDKEFKDIEQQLNQIIVDFFPN